MLVSVYIPTKNRLALLKRAVESVLAQTYAPIELVVADDGSTDGSREYLAQMQAAGRLKAVFLPVSMGACVARNLAISEASGTFVTGLDDDDYFTSDRIEKFVAAWEKAAGEGRVLAGVFDSVCEVRPHGRSIRRTRTAVSAEELRRSGLVGNQLFSLREYYIGAGLFDPAMPIWQDWDLWVRIGKTYGDFVGLNASTYIIDAAHDYNRITRKPGFMVRHGVSMYLHKHGPFTASQRAAILVSMAGYPQVRLSAIELALLLGTGNLMALAKYAVRRTFGDNAYEKLKFATVLSPGRRVSSGAE